MVSRGKYTSWCCFAIFSSSSLFFLAFSLSILASWKQVMKWSKIPKNSSLCVVTGSSQNSRHTRSNYGSRKTVKGTVAHEMDFWLLMPCLISSRRREIIVRGQSYFSRLPKYWPPIPLTPRLCCGGEDRLAGRRGGWGVNILEDERNRIALLQWSLYGSRPSSHPVKLYSTTATELNLSDKPLKYKSKL